MQTRVGLWGGSCAIRLPKMVVETLGLQEGEPVLLDIRDGALVVRPGKPTYQLDDLVREAKALVPPASHDDASFGEEIL